MGKRILFFIASFFICAGAGAQTDAPQTSNAPAVDDVKAFMDKAAANAQDKSFSYTLEIKEKNKSRKAKIYQKKDKMRMEVSLYENAALKKYSETVIMTDGNVTYMYLPQMNVATKGDTKAGWAIPAAKDLAGYTLGDEMTINGLDCRMMKNAQKGTETCVSETYGIPVYSKEGANEAYIVDLKETNIDDELFKLPPTVSLL